MHEPKWCLFFDFHTMPACPDVGAKFDMDAITDHIKSCGVDYIVFPARCNLGVAYYNTEVGIRHRSLTYDLYGKLAEACAARDIAITAYINVGLSHEEALLHREWCVLTPEGYVYRPDRLNHFFRNMCYNTGYGDHVVEMAKEVVSRYPTAGLFLDCMHTTPCVGVECIREMKERGMDWKDDQQLYDFSYMTQVRMARRIADATKAINPELLLYCNGIDYEAQDDIGTYLEFECLPTGGWGYESLPMGARYLRTLGKPVLNMTGRFHRSWGDFGGIRTEPSLEYDCLYGLANGMRTTIGDHFHPRGDINWAAFNMYKRLYDRLRQLEPWVDGAEPVVDAAALQLAPYPGYKYRSPAKRELFGRSFNAMKGASRVLCELKQQFDIVSHFADWDKYQLLVLPDFVTLDDETTKRVRKHLDAGGAVLSTGWSGLDPDEQQFVLDDWGLSYDGPDPFDPAFVKFGEALSAGMPDMPVTLYDRGTAVTAAPGTDVLAHIIAPYYNRHWDGEHGFLYMPPDRLTERPAATISGRVAHVSHPIFTTYFNCAPIPMRQLVANLLERILPRPLLRTSNLPSFARATVTAQPSRRMVHLLSYVPERRGASVDMIEEPIEVRNVDVALRLDERPPQRVYLAPSEQDLEFSVVDGYVQVRVPEMRGYALVVFEE